MLFDGIFLIVLSLVAVPSLLLSKKPNAQELLNKIVPYQGWFGVVACFWGIWEFVQLIMAISLLSAGVTGIIIWLTYLVYVVVEFSLGFILGYALIAQYVFKGEKAQAKGEQLLAKLQPMAGRLGIVGLIVGLWCIVCYFILVVAMVAA